MTDHADPVFDQMLAQIQASLRTFTIGEVQDGTFIEMLARALPSWTLIASVEAPGEVAVLMYRADRWFVGYAEASAGEWTDLEIGQRLERMVEMVTLRNGTERICSDALGTATLLLAGGEGADGDPDPASSALLVEDFPERVSLARVLLDVVETGPGGQHERAEIEAMLALTHPTGLAAIRSGRDRWPVARHTLPDVARSGG